MKIISYYLKYNIIILNENDIAKKLFMVNNIKGKNLYFVVDEEASHIEPLKQNNFLFKDDKLLERTENLLKCLIAFNEANKINKLDLPDNID